MGLEKKKKSRQQLKETGGEELIYCLFMERGGWLELLQTEKVSAWGNTESLPRLSKANNWW